MCGRERECAQREGATRTAYNRQIWFGSRAEHTHLCLSLLNFVFFFNLLFILFNKLFFYLNKCVLSLILSNSEKLLNKSEVGSS